MRKRVFIAISTVVLAACSGTHVGTPRAEMLGYQTHRTYGALYTLAVAHGEALNSAVKADTLHPGMYAEYGVALALMGHKSAACRMLNAEARTFPESRAMVRRIKERLMPDMLQDTVANKKDTANLAQLAGWAYDSVYALRQLPYVAPVVDSTDTLRIRMQTPVDSVEIPVRLTATQKREQLERAQMAEVMRKQALADSVAAAKQAKVDARKQAQADRKKEKKEREKANRQAKKEQARQRKEKQKKN